MSDVRMITDSPRHYIVVHYDGRDHVTISKDRDVTRTFIAALQVFPEGARAEALKLCDAGLQDPTKWAEVRDRHGFGGEHEGVRCNVSFHCLNEVQVLS